MKPVINAAIAETVLITYRDLKNSSNVDNPIPHFPMPSQFVSVVIVYGALTFLPERADKVAALFGWGLVVATLLNLWKPGRAVQTTTANAQTPSTKGS